MPSEADSRVPRAGEVHASGDRQRWAGGGGAYRRVACLGPLAIDDTPRGPLSRRSTEHPFLYTAKHTRTHPLAKRHFVTFQKQEANGKELVI